MAFNIMDLFGPGALNRLLQPAPNTQGVQNMLASRPDVQPAPAVAGVDPWQGMREEDVMRVDPMQTASAAQPVQQVQRRAPVGLGGLLSDDKKALLNDIFTGWAMGSTPSDSLGKGAQLVAANRGTRKNVNDTVEWLKGKGVSEGDARRIAANPPALNEYLKTMAEGNDPQKALQLEKTQLEINKLKQGRPENYTPLTSEEKKQLGLDPSKAYQRGADNKISEIGGNGTNVTVEAPKLPSGYRFVDTANPTVGVEPIPGGPAEQIPGELAARIGMANNFLAADLPAIRSAVKKGNVTGVYDRFQAANNSGSDQARTYQKIQSGVEVLSRLLSGAGMTKDEIAEKAARYLPTYTDDTESVAAKMDQLEAELIAAKDMAMRGRGPSSQQDQNADPLGIR